MNKTTRRFGSVAIGEKLPPLKIDITSGLIIGGAMVAYFGTVGYYIGDYGVTGMLFNERIYAILTLKDAVNLSLAALIVTLVASVYPASLAARLEPVEALRGGRQA